MSNKVTNLASWELAAQIFIYQFNVQKMRVYSHSVKQNKKRVKDVIRVAI